MTIQDTTGWGKSFLKNIVNHLPLCRDCFKITLVTLWCPLDVHKDVSDKHTTGVALELEQQSNQLHTLLVSGAGANIIQLQRAPSPFVSMMVVIAMVVPVPISFYFIKCVSVGTEPFCLNDGGDCYGSLHPYPISYHLYYSTSSTCFSGHRVLLSQWWRWLPWRSSILKFHLINLF